MFNFPHFVYYHNGNSLSEVNEGIAESCKERENVPVFIVLSLHLKSKSGARKVLRYLAVGILTLWPFEMSVSAQSSCKIHFWA